MQQPQVAVINCGSSSVKFALVDPASDVFPLQGLAERLGSDHAVIRWRNGVGKQEQRLPGADHRAALERAIQLMSEQAQGAIAAVGHRVVHGGESFKQATALTADAMAAIRDATVLAPLHNPANITGIEAVTELYPALPQYAVFDTAFHQTLPDYAFHYAVPHQLYTQYGVRRYGFHGTSHDYVSRQVAQLAGLPRDGSQWITVHLGNGCSTCAVKDGRSVDTSMGFTPLEGLVMGTRSGDVDPNLHGFLERNLNWDIGRIEQVLNAESGLLGVSGLSNDMRTLQQAAADGHEQARLAVDIFCYRAAKSILSMAAALTRLDGIVFTAGIGENSAWVRGRICQHLEVLGVVLDDDKNAAAVGGQAAAIQRTGVPVWVVPTNEERQIALETLALLTRE